jgi:hypothetical protein
MPLFVVQTNPVTGRDDDFNAWYVDQHLPEVLRVPGFVAARRYQKSGAQRLGVGDADQNPWKYLAIYEIEGDPARAMAALDDALNSWMSRSPTLADHRSSIVYEEMGERVVKRRGETGD